ncbi:flagellar hook-basal body complex protein FliE [Thaumasiovibrio sp. DFM-14]|uniref:flagellar hook-basal body complex protein FliE n=1 Tax=Thaumasiovibrio sp. DFM-14 TaxID=3384792 RepID=UPI0039A1AD14
MSVQSSEMQQAMQARMMHMREQAQMGRISPQPESQQPVAQASFSQVMTQKLRQVDNQQAVADRMTADVDAGRSDDLVGAMVASQKASLSFSALTQVRNKIIAAYDDVLKMPL